MPTTLNKIHLLVLEIDEALTSGSWRTAANKSRCVLEAVLQRLQREVLRIDTKERNLHNTINSDGIKGLFPKRLIGRMWYVKEIGDAGSHEEYGNNENYLVTEEDARRAYLDIVELVAFVNDQYVVRNLSNILDHPKLSVVVEEDLTSLLFRYKSNNLIMISNPVLLLETCSGPNAHFGFSKDGYATANLFESKRNESRVVKENMGSRNLINFGSIRVVWDDSYCEWPPSIDSLFTGSVILSPGFLADLLGRSSSFAEIGCGTGFVSALVCKNFRIHQLYLTDLHDRILEIARFNVHANCPDQRMITKTGYGFLPLRLANIRCDVIFSNPPYLIKGEDLETDSPTRTTGLLDELLMDFWQYSESLVLNYSSCSLRHMKSILERLNSQGISLKERLVSRKKVPFRIPRTTEEELDVLSNQGLIIDLEDPNHRCRNDDLCKDNRGFRFWHEIFVSVFSIDSIPKEMRR